MRQYFKTRDTYSGSETFFVASLIVADLAAALTAESGEAWDPIVHQRDEPDDSYQGANVRRVRDGLQVWIQQEAYNRRRRGRASIDWSGSGCGQYWRSEEARQCTFDPTRPLKPIARQILRGVVEPTAEAVTRLRKSTSEWEDRIARTSAALDRLSRTPGAQVEAHNGMSDRYVRIGPMSFKVDAAGSVRVHHFHGGDVNDLFDLAEFYASMNRQLGAQAS